MERTVFCIVRKRVTTLRLRSDRFTVWRARLEADFVFAIVIKKLWTCTLASALRLSTLKVFPAWIHTPARKRRICLRAERYNRLSSSSFAFCR